MAQAFTYKNFKILAPMVRMGTLPMRLLCLDYGADLVYCEEIIDHKLAKCKRVENRALNSIDFIHPDGTCVFRTCHREADKVILQLGTADPDRALLTAKLVENDVAGIDINMGCPKDYSTKGGMGAALLKEPQKVYNILKKLVDNCVKPVTCKIRILPNLQDTLHLAKIIESTGVAAVAVHGRLKTERPRQPVHKDIIRTIADTLSIPVIANGGSLEIKNFDDIEKFQQETNAASVMIARAAQWNPSIFRKEGSLHSDEIIKAYIKYAIDYDNHWSNSKYCIIQFMHGRNASELGMELAQTTSMLDISALWGFENYHRSIIAKREELVKSDDSVIDLLTSSSIKTSYQFSKQPLLSDIGSDHNRHVPHKSITPKSLLYQWSKNCGYDAPIYRSDIEPESKLFYSRVVVNGKEYAAESRQKNKRSAEQSAATKCIKILKIDTTKVNST